MEEEQAKSPFAGEPIFPSPCSVESPHGKIQSQKRSETTGGRLEELRDASRRRTPTQALEWWERRKTQVVLETLGKRELGVEELVGEAGGVVIRQQGELEDRPALGDQQNLVVDDTDDTLDKEATKALPATKLEIDHPPFLAAWDTHPAACCMQVAGCQTETTQYRIVWGNIQTSRVPGSTKTMYRY